MVNGCEAATLGNRQESRLPRWHPSACPGHDR